MTYQQIEDIIADKVAMLRRKREKIEAALDIAEIDSQQAVELDNVLRATVENLSLIETIALYLLQQSDEIARKDEEISALTNQVLALKAINQRLTIRHNAARAVQSLISARIQTIERETNDFILSQFEDENELQIVKNLLATAL